MIELGGIYTIRNTKQPFYWDVVFRWENEFSRTLNIPLVEVGHEYDNIYKPSIARKVLNRINFYQASDRLFFNPKKHYLAFHIGPPGVYSFHSRKNVIPIIIDFWKSEDLKRFESIFALNKLVFITSREVYNYLLHKKIDVRIEHLALSLPDGAMADVANEKRKFDLIQLGRQNQQLTSFTKKFLEEFPSTNYIYAEKIDGRMQMFSTRDGALGEFPSHESLLNLLKQTKVSLVSAPGLDDDAQRTGGFSPVTPRFLESAACGCHLVGVYPDNDDFRYFGIDEICANVTDYDSFKSIVLQYLHSQSAADHRSFLTRHLSGTRANELKEKLSLHYAKS